MARVQRAETKSQASDPERAARKSIEAAIRETCDIRDWWLRAINVRTNHIHTVVSASHKKPELVLNALKANATRQCGKMVFGHTPSVPGQTKVAREDFGMNEVLKEQLAM